MALPTYTTLGPRCPVMRSRWATVCSSSALPPGVVHPPAPNPGRLCASTWTRQGSAHTTSRCVCREGRDRDPLLVAPSSRRTLLSPYPPLAVRPCRSRPAFLPQPTERANVGGVEVAKPMLKQLPPHRIADLGHPQYRRAMIKAVHSRGGGGGGGGGDPYDSACGFVRLDGDAGSAERRGLILDAFRDDPQTTVMLLTKQAAGVVRWGGQRDATHCTPPPTRTQGATLPPPPPPPPPSGNQPDER